jgi:hypothetical protein
MPCLPSPLARLGSALYSIPRSARVGVGLRPYPCRSWRELPLLPPRRRGGHPCTPPSPPLGGSGCKTLCRIVIDCPDKSGTEWEANRPRRVHLRLFLFTPARCSVTHKSRVATSLCPRPSLTSRTTSSSAGVSDAQPLLAGLRRPRPLRAANRLRAWLGERGGDDHLPAPHQCIEALLCDLRGVVFGQFAHLRVVHVGAAKEVGVGRPGQQRGNGDARVAQLVAHRLSEGLDNDLDALYTVW